jgi:hypothetical protein
MGTLLGFIDGNTCGPCARVESVGIKNFGGNPFAAELLPAFQVILGNRLAIDPARIVFHPEASSFPAQPAHFDGIFFLLF